ncbi:PLP-dependent aminotransferase family protein [Desulfocurvus sp.]|uniref:aminotransferase-like domain-containing protein n=1 Tax=Desulfocurvus sp. TaxID=2871698 RepID=UPI0025C5DA70|nr:PLP-dependent aminotransferase family protein [Desulfocurvus sp.]MCK9241432.1 PLP-dependent aminotransferase family protein [Desulfocurvus sp.]
MPRQAGSDDFRYQTVERHVRELIEAGALPPGSRLPSLRALAARVHASVSTINQAYLELEAKGLVESRPRSGFYVRPARRRLRPPGAGPAPSGPRAVTRGGLIGTVLEAVGDPRLTPLGIICPTSELLPVRHMARLMAEAVRQAPEAALEYSPIPGLADLRRQLAVRGLEAGVACGPDEIMVTQGAMEALYIALRAVTRPGDTVLVQSPTYFCFLQLLENMRLRAVEVPSRAEGGIDPAEIRAALDRFEIAACILSANFNNPDGALMPEEAKAEVVDMLARRAVPLIEDDVSGDLHFGPHRPAPLKHYDRAGGVILCSSFSKTICPGYRLGWMMPGRALAKALEIKATTNVCNPAPTQMAVAAYLRRGLYDRHLRELRKAMETQRDTMLHHIGMHFPEQTRATRPDGGAVLWLELPRQVDGVELFYRAREDGISIAPGSIFSTLDRFRNFIRLSTGGVWNQRLARGVAALGALAAEMAAAPPRGSQG